MGLRMPDTIAIVAFLGCTLGPGVACSQPTTIAEDMRAAVISYADEKLKETVKEQSRAAITALYKKIYRSGANKRLVRTLGVVALSAEEINTLAENAANASILGDPERIKAASAQVAVALGRTLTKGLSDPALRGEMIGLLGSVDTVNEMSAALGRAAGGDPQAAYELAGRTLISLTPAAAAFTAAEVATGTMKYLHGKFVDGTLEELYQKYAEGDAQTRADIRTQLETVSLYSYIVRNRRIELADERADSIALATAEPSDVVRERITAARESEVIDNILNTFAARATRERTGAVAEEARKRAEAEAAAMIDTLDVAASEKYGKDWWSERPFNLERFVRMVRERVEKDGVLDPNDPKHVRSMAQLLSTRLVHGADSERYREQLEGFEAFRRVVQGDYGAPAEGGTDAESQGAAQDAAKPCAPGSASREEAEKLWAQALRQIRSNDPHAGWAALKAGKRSIAICPDGARSAELKKMTDWHLNRVIARVVKGMKQGR